MAAVTKSPLLLPQRSVHVPPHPPPRARPCCPTEFGDVEPHARRRSSLPRPYRSATVSKNPSRPPSSSSAARRPLPHARPRCLPSGAGCAASAREKMRSHRRPEGTSNAPDPPPSAPDPLEGRADLRPRGLASAGSEVHCRRLFLSIRAGKTSWGRRRQPEPPCPRVHPRARPPPRDHPGEGGHGQPWVQAAAARFTSSDGHIGVELHHVLRPASFPTQSHGLSVNASKDMNWDLS
ncbi:unnamed protein product [Urochloa humidicola]